MRLDDFAEQVEIDPMYALDSDDLYAVVRALCLSEEPERVADDLSIPVETINAYDDTLDKLNREDLTELLLDLSLCPLHQIDYAICFDELTPECAAIRMIHPSHDT